MDLSHIKTSLLALQVLCEIHAVVNRADALVGVVSHDK